MLYSKKKGLSYLETIISITLFMMLSLTIFKLLSYSTNSYNVVKTNIMLHENCLKSISYFENYLHSYNDFDIIYENENFQGLIIYKQGFSVPSDVFILEFLDNKISFGGKADNGIFYTNLLSNNIKDIKFTIDPDNNIGYLEIIGIDGESEISITSHVNIKYKNFR